MYPSLPSQKFMSDHQTKSSFSFRPASGQEMTDTETEDGSPSPVNSQSDEQDDGNNEDGNKRLSEAELVAPEKIRHVVRITQCRQCSRPYRDPLALPCGSSVCKPCLPEIRPRANVSYPASADRQQAFRCPFVECGKDHALGDCAIDVTLKKVLENIAAEVIKQRTAVEASGVSTTLGPLDSRAATGIPSMMDPAESLLMGGGGHLLVTFALAESGRLKFDAEVVFEGLQGTMDANNDNGSAVDRLIIDKLRDSARPDVECHICYALLFEPVTTACGHTFCRRCLQQMLDHSTLCPICRRRLYLSRGLLNSRKSCPSSALLTGIISTFWPRELRLRSDAVVAEEEAGRHGEFDTPLFVCTLSFPQIPTYLHVFEPRYCLMIRRAIEGNRTFGMVMPRHIPSSSSSSSSSSNTGQFVEIGTLLRIIRVASYPDGRSMLETMGVSRFRILQHSILDGYALAKTEPVDDISLAEEEMLEVAETTADTTADTILAASPKTAVDLERMSTAALMEFADRFVSQMHQESVTWLTSRILTVYGARPDDPAMFPWWFASVVPVKEVEKYALVGAVSVRQRLKICCGWVLEWEGR